MLDRLGPPVAIPGHHRAQRGPIRHVPVVGAVPLDISIGDALVFPPMSDDDGWDDELLTVCHRCATCVCFGGDMKLFLMLAAAAVLSFCVRWPHLIARHLAAHVAGDVLWSVRSSTRVVALTFDDGPHPATTPGLVDLLGRYGARATFFLIGVRASRHEDLVRQIVDGGNELGNHLLSDYPSILLSTTEFRAQLVQVNATLRRFGTVKYFRPGSGFFTPRMLQIAADNSYRCALGTISTLDINSRNPQSVARRIAGKVRPGDVIVLHEGSPYRRRVVTVVEGLLADLTARGYRFVTLTELAGRPVFSDPLPVYPDQASRSL